MQTRLKWIAGGVVALCVIALCGAVAFYFIIPQEPSYNSWYAGGVSHCITSFGFTCGEIFYIGATGNLSVSMGQRTWQTWTGWAVGYASNETVQPASGPPSIQFVPVQGAATLASGRNATALMTVPDALRPDPRWPLISGSVWVCYTTDGGVTGMAGGDGTCTPLGNPNAHVTYAKAISFRTIAN
jgi:hypothetical protein